MASNYKLICEENRRRYGTEGAQKSGGLAARLYDDRTHFIYELLQNAEDALGRRGDWNGSRKVEFSLTGTQLRVSHYGKPFDEADVRSVCDIAESTKNESSIGRFGLGFKSVYTVTDLPEIHSGEEDFAIEGYVFPKEADRTDRGSEETQILLPLKPEDITAPLDIETGLRNLGPGALLFLRNIEEINWRLEDGATGFYLRNSPEILGPNVHRITVIGQISGQSEVDETWLVFHRDVFTNRGQKVGSVEIAFSTITGKDDPKNSSVQPLANSPLVVFFPTVVESHLGFLVQGPYRTTPSRDNIPPADPWNQHLVAETAQLLVEAMRWMRDNFMLDVSALRCLPLDREKFPQDSRFAPMFEAVHQAFQDEPLLPASDGSYVTASQAKLSRTQDLRDLLSPEQITALLSSEFITWLSGEITQDKAPDVLKYLTQELNIDLVTPTKLVANLSKQFLEEQPDKWMLRLYEFLNGQEAALRRYLDKIPLVRLEDGTHVLAREQGEAKAFLPSNTASGFPAVRRAVCSSTDALAFLVSLKITEPDPIDDVIRNILPKYQQDEVDVDSEAYAADIERIRTAFSTDSASQKEKLREALRETPFIMVVDAGDGQRYVNTPGTTYIATERLKQLFAGVKDVFIVDDDYDCLRGEGVRDLMESCGAVRYPRPLEAPYELSYNEKLELRKKTGYSTTSGANDRVTDWVLDGFDALIELMPTLSVEHRADRAQLLWDSIGDLEERRGRGVFDGSYTWSHYGERKTPPFPAAFLRKLNIAAWVPDSKGELVPPGLVVFDTLGWKTNPFLLTKITFKPPILDQLAKEAGIDPEALDLLRKYGITSVDELAARLGIPNPPAIVEPGLDTQPDAVISLDIDVYEDAVDLYGDDMPEIQPGTPDPDGGDHTTVSVGPNGQGHARSGNPSSGSHRNNVGGSGNHSTAGGSGNTGADSDHSKRPSGQSGSRPFISYVGAQPDDVGSDPDGLDQAERMRIEEHAIALIVKLEPTFLRTVEGNPGFDLYETDSAGNLVRWIEVKSMTGSLNDRPVGVSHTQFECAREKGDAYWLYIVEHASNPSQARVLRIQNPVSQCKTFTFDRGWSQIALVDPPNR